MAAPTSKALLVILDGYGIAENPEVSAIDKADKPFIDKLFQNNPHSKLTASGKDVGLPDGQFGNSEVGHLNIGAGRVVWQELTRINRDIEEGTFNENEVLLEAIEKAKPQNKVHILGLFSDGGVHSHNNHLFALLRLLNSKGLDNAFVHAFTDGRDTAPTGGVEYMKEFQKQAEEIGTGTIASIVGRYYAMDRDNRWERTKLAYDLLVNGQGEAFDSPIEALEDSYDDDVTDEFVKPKLIDSSPESRIAPGDVVIFYNIRGDRARQITRALTEDGFDEFNVKKDLDLHYVTFTSYDDTIDWVHVAYPPLDIKNTIGELVSSQGLKQLRIAETEKYPHVTYFFNGGDEVAFEGEDRIMIPSPKVATYDLQPEMSAPQVADTLCEQLEADKYDLCILNFANPDMVGHTGDMDAAIKAVETIDTELEKVIETATEHNYKILVIADHGNADCLVQADGSPHTAHTTALVPAMIINGNGEKITMHDGKLADIAPTLLKLMGLGAPEEMTGEPLF
ncbi:2,3-bisphosphoglycerate-independent phosphoglycerate mutase [Aliifodinibius sp. S!AR15-10]|uniref:2,3-bisphosphoglycerate-independent phosphoglycerate mutase n=1 Tax=Aliifodinibius sp. S!AR15-10 TaxID=2950437 RepID=UPI0028586EC5|nr:2,3-bisphosphoglycerate-independent phosphoglycerate mutase [Aliifodinibius sp. S!AR15-10]MDR8390581.1 2,3-bisphosphoglycerate-independent phosphoglycerate mutase [Aliifodinibius sp. S!AR15-10]